MIKARASDHLADQQLNGRWIWFKPPYPSDSAWSWCLTNKTSSPTFNFWMFARCCCIAVHTLSLLCDCKSVCQSIQELARNKYDMIKIENSSADGWSPANQDLPLPCQSLWTNLMTILRVQTFPSPGNAAMLRSSLAKLHTPWQLHSGSAERRLWDCGKGPCPLTVAVHHIPKVGASQANLDDLWHLGDDFLTNHDLWSGHGEICIQSIKWGTWSLWQLLIADLWSPTWCRSSTSSKGRKLETLAALMLQLVMIIKILVQATITIMTTMTIMTMLIIRIVLTTILYNTYFAHTIIIIIATTIVRIQCLVSSQ